MTQSFIGWWANRKGQRWHLVESEITDRLIMHCGRQMRLDNGAGHLVFQQQPQGRTCLFCAMRRHQP